LKDQLAITITIHHTRSWTLAGLGGPRELIRAVNPCIKEVSVVFYTLQTLTAFIITALNAVRSTTAPVATRLHWSCVLWVRVGCDGMAIVTDGRRTVAGD